MGLWRALLTGPSRGSSEWQVRRGLKILDRAIQYGPRLVKCHYRSGEKARKHFKTALELSPDDAFIHMLYAVANFYCAEPKRAKTELKQASRKHPKDFEIRGLVDYDPWWRDVFHVPPWSSTAARVPPILGEKIKGKVVLPVRQGTQRIHSFFFRRQRPDDFAGNVAAGVACRIYPHIVKSPELTGLAVVGCVKDNPANPLKAEAFIFPGAGDEGKQAIVQLLQLAQQSCAYLVIIDPDDRVLFNARVAFDDHATRTFSQAAALAPSLSSQTLTLEGIQRSVRWYQSQFALEQISL